MQASRNIRQTIDTSIRAAMMMLVLAQCTHKSAVIFPRDTPATGEAPGSSTDCPIFPADNIWNRRVDDLPIHPRSSQYIRSIGANRNIHPDFGSGVWPPGSTSPIGIPYNFADQSTPTYTVQFQYHSESDRGPYPIPDNVLREGGPDATTGDRHILVINTANCSLYELFAAERSASGWRAGSGAIFDLRSNQLRPDTWTSADAAGLPILPGLVRYEEVQAGAIRHALRFTAPRTQRAYVWPARHYASSRTDPALPPLGMRFRLKQSIDAKQFSPRVRVIVRALQQYGMMLADNGSAWYLSGAPSKHWNNQELRELRKLRGMDFEAVDVKSLMVAADSAQARP